MNIYPHWDGQPEPEGDSRNIRSDRLVYRVEALPHQINVPWGLIGTNGTTIPIQGGAHPYNAGLFADTYSVRLHGVESLVTIKFSNNRQWRQANPPPDPTEPGFSSWSQASVITLVKVPILLKVPQTIGLPSGPVTKNVWTVREVEVPHSQTITTWRGSLAAYSPSQGEDLINAQVDKIHQFVAPNGAKRLFLGALFDQRALRWEAQYQWRIDHGTPRPANWVDTATKIYPPTLSGSGANAIVRLPFQTFGVLPSANAETTPPTIYVENLKAENLTGWTTLPGPIPPP